MVRPVSEQLALFLRAVALGLALGLVYDVLRTLRSLGGKLWGGALDALFCLTAAAALFLFVMAGDGEMRIFVVLGAVGGMVLFLCLASPLLQPVWRFWLALLLFPLRTVKKIIKKCGWKVKKLFSFGRIRVIMIAKHLRVRGKQSQSEGGDGDGQDAIQP